MEMRSASMSRETTPATSPKITPLTTVARVSLETWVASGYRRRRSPSSAIASRIRG